METIILGIPLFINIFLQYFLWRDTKSKLVLLAFLWSILGSILTILNIFKYSSDLTNVLIFIAGALLYKIIALTVMMVRDSNKLSVKTKWVMAASIFVSATGLTIGLMYLILYSKSNSI